MFRRSGDKTIYLVQTQEQFELYFCSGCGDSSCMTTTLDRFDPATLSRAIRMERAKSVHSTLLLKPIPAEFIGVQEGFGNIPAFALYNLIEGIEGHPSGSTVSFKTIIAKGYVPALMSI